MMNAQPQKEHEWLHKFVGEWTFEGEATMAPDQPPEKFKGVETVRDIGGLWIVAEGKGECPGGMGEATTLLTIGFDTQKKRYVGTFVASMMTYLWVYDDGELDAAEKVLSLYADGPDFKVEGKLAKYKDVTEFKSNDHRVLSSYLLGDDGQWHCIMTAHYRRRRSI
jgi:hypothetical protein